MCNVTVAALTPKKFRLLPDTPQMLGVFTPKVTVKPEDEVAVMTNGELVRLLSGIGPKVMAWPTFVANS